jgi:hypothetical protein
MTLLQCISGYIDNVTVTDKQEEDIKGSVSNLDSHLDKNNGLHVKRTFTNGSYDRDTMNRPLNDIDVFAVLDREKWKDEYGNLPNPQAVLTKFRNFLNDQDDYKDKVRQDRPCVTIELSKKDFDILPSFEELGGGYLIPNDDLTSWTYTYPEQLSSNLDNINQQRSYKIKPTIRGVKNWNRDNQHLIPSYHIEEVAINIFTQNAFTNYEQSIRLWFENAETYLLAHKFKSNDDYTKAVNKIRKVKDKLIDAHEKYESGDENNAITIWKDIFQKEFPTVSDEEAKNYSKALSEGNLRINAGGLLSTSAGTTITASKGFFGDIPNS